MKVKAQHNYKIEFAKVRKEDGSEEDFKFNFVLTLSRPVHQVGGVEGIQKFLMEDIGGIDQVKMIGNYTLECFVPRTFDPDEVVAAIEANIGTLQSDIVTPNKR